MVSCSKNFHNILIGLGVSQDLILTSFKKAIQRLGAWGTWHVDMQQSHTGRAISAKLIVTVKIQQDLCRHQRSTTAYYRNTFNFICTLP